MPTLRHSDSSQRRAVAEQGYARSEAQYRWSGEHYRQARQQRLTAMQARWRARSAMYDRFGPVVAMARDASHELGDVALALVEAGPDALVMASEGGQILAVNRQTERLFGYDRDELLGQPVELLLPERYRQAHRAHRTRYRAEPRLRPMGAGLLLFGLRKDGAEFPVEISLSPLAGPSGLLIVASVRDISERLVAEARVREVQRVLDATRDAVLMFDPDTLMFTYVNQGAIDQLGYARDELLTMTPLHIKPEFTEEQYRALAASLAPGESHTYGTVHRRKDGEDIQVEAVLVRPPHVAGGEGWLVSVARDLTDRLDAEERAHAAERQVAVLEDRQRIARELHDQVIQRLFAAGLGLSAIAASAQDPTLAGRLAGVVEDLDATIRQLRASIFDLNRAPGAASSLRATLVEVCRGERAALGFDPTLHFEGPVDAVGDALVGHAVAVVREALSNAARHAAATAVEISITASEHLVLRVADDGVGLPSRAGHAGDGIGNMVARAEALGGTCSVHARHGGGTEVVWRIPL